MMAGEADGGDGRPPFGATGVPTPVDTWSERPVQRRAEPRAGADSECLAVGISSSPTIAPQTA